MRECGGCAAKVSAETLAALLRGFDGAREAEGSLVGLRDADDASVVRLDDDHALITTVDACPPMVDDPEQFGAITAANAVGDVLAMGGRVLSALAILAIPREVNPAIAAGILHGARGVIEHCGGALVGGHSVHSAGTLFGLSVTGLVHPDRIWRSRGALPGDRLVLSRPIGVGVAISHAGVGTVEHDDVVARVRRPALDDAAALHELGDRVHAVTDVTGFGLLGHALDLVADHTGLLLDARTIPVLPVAWNLIARGARTSAHEANLRWVTPRVAAHGLDDALLALLVDPQTTGGLLAAIGPGPLPRGFVEIGRFVSRRDEQHAVSFVEDRATSGAA